MSSDARNRKPWPMKWVVLAIIAVIVPYTWITLHYRKPGKAFEPYVDMKNQANTKRLLAAGYRASHLPLRPVEADASATAASTNPAPGGLPSDLATVVVEQPALPAGYAQITAPAAVTTGETVGIEFAAEASTGGPAAFASAVVYLRENQLVIAPVPSTGEASTAGRLRLDLPAGLLSPGEYTVTLCGSSASATWTLQVH